jgi:hypothetical protein
MISDVLSYDQTQKSRSSRVAFLFFYKYFKENLFKSRDFKVQSIGHEIY